MLMVNALSDSTSSKKAMEMMGAEITDVNIKFNEKTDKAEIDKVLDIIEKKSEINKRCFHYGVNISLNGEEIFCNVNNYPEDTLVKKGRAPLYDNEIVITEMVADELDLKIGDTIDAARFDKHEQFIVSGIYVSLYDTGMAVSINADAGKKLGIEAKVTSGGVNLKNSEDAEKVRAALEKEYGDKAEITLTDPDDDLGLINNAVRAMRIIIYAFSLFFALVVVSMVSSKAFTQEKTDIGIFKSQGFTTGKLRLQFAIRFFIVSVIGAILGTFTGTLLINKVLSLLLRGIGITNFYTSFTITGILMPAAAICICFFIFALIVSRKIKKVGIRQLITE